MNYNKPPEMVKLTFTFTKNEDCRLSKDIDNTLKKSVVPIEVPQKNRMYY